MEIEVSQGLLRETATELKQIMSQMGDSPLSMLLDYDIRIVDGSCLAITEQRLKPTREVKAAPLPSKAVVVVVFDPTSKLVLDILCEEDDYTQERAFCLKDFRKTPRTQKKPKATLIKDPQRPHVSTARLLREN